MTSLFSSLISDNHFQFLPFKLSCIQDGENTKRFTGTSKMYVPEKVQTGVGENIVASEDVV